MMTRDCRSATCLHFQFLLTPTAFDLERDHPCGKVACLLRTVLGDGPIAAELLGTLARLCGIYHGANKFCKVTKLIEL